MSLLFLAGFVFLCVAFLVGAIFWSASSAQEARVRTRLSQLEMRDEVILDRDLLSIVREEVLSDIPFLNSMLRVVPFARHINGIIVQADLPFKVATFVMFSLALGGLGFLLTLAFRRPMALGAILGVLLAVLPYVLVRLKRAKVIRVFTEQLPEALESMGRSLRAGHGLTAAMELVGREMEEPIAKIFRLAYDEQKLGLSLQETLRNMTGRIKSIDLEFFATAVLVQRETGGNLAELFDKLAYVIRERLKIRGQIQIYSAQGKLTGYILAALPFVAALMISIINPSYMSLLFSERLGILMVVYGLVSMGIGFFVIRKIIDIRI